MKSFRLTRSGSRPRLNRQSQEAFLYAVQHNYILETFFMLETMELDFSMNFYLALNRMGRKRIVDETATREDLVGVVLNAQVDLNCLHYLISMKPQLLEESFGAGPL
jgi:hypothetical protein